MSPLRQTAALLVIIAILASGGGIPLPEETNNEIDNIIPQVGEQSLCRYSVPLITRLMCLPLAGYETRRCLYVYVKSMGFVSQPNKRGFH
jgi:hypothetical protein